MPRRGGRRLSGGAGGGGGPVHPGHVLSHNRVQATMHNWGQVSLAVSTLGLASFEVFQACKQEHLQEQKCQRVNFRLLSGDISASTTLYIMKAASNEFFFGHPVLALASRGLLN